MSAFETGKLMHLELATLAQDLDAIDGQGAAWLDRERRRAAWRCGLDRAIPLMPGVPLVGFVLGWMVPIRPEGVALLTLGATGAVVLAGYALVRRGQVARARAGLALYDRELALKDRLRMADEFASGAGGIAVATGFRGAALAEAAPFVAHARATRLPAMAEAAPHGGRMARWAFLASLLFAATVVQQHFLQPDLSRPLAGRLVHAVQAVPGVNLIMRASTTRDGGLDPAPSRTGALAGQEHNGQLGGSAALAGDGTQAGPRGNTAGSAGGDGRAVPGGGAGSGAGAGGASSPVAAQIGPQAMGQPPHGSGAPDAAHGAPSAAPNGTPGAADSAAVREAGASGHAAGDAKAPPPSEPAAAQGNPMQGQAGNGPGNRRSNRSQQNGQSQSSETSQGKGEGTQARRTGEDALKAARGTLSLMLAVPMQDKLGGMASPGLVTSTLRQGQPQPSQAVPQPAGARGVASGNAGRMAHRPLTPQERRLMQGYFRPGGAAP